MCTVTVITVFLPWDDNDHILALSQLREQRVSAEWQAQPNSNNIHDTLIMHEVRVTLLLHSVTQMLAR